MRLLFYLFCTCILVTTSNAQSSTYDAEIRFDMPSQELGKIKQGTIATREYTFQNMSKTALILTSVSSSCSCATVTYPHTPIHPGKTGVIKVVYNSKDRKGAFNVKMTVESNAKPVVLTLAGEVN